MKIKSQKFGLPSMILLGINSILGTGIFLLPGKAMALVGPASILVYLFVTLVAVAIAFCFAECASLFSRNGAAYLYAKEAFGSFIGFEVGIMKWAVSMIAWATLAVGFVTVVEQIFPILEPMHHVLLVTLIGSLGAINICGIQLVRMLSNLISISKIVPLMGFLLFGLFFMERENFFPFVPIGLEYTSFGAAALLIFFAFSGFEALAVAAEDMENPKRNLPLAIFAIIGITSLIYLFTQVVVIGVLGTKLAGSHAPLAQAAELMGGPIGKWSVTFGMLISGLGTNIAASFMAPRSAVALAQDGIMPRVIASPGRFGTPAFAIVATTLVTLMIALSGSFVKLATISVIARFVQYFSTCLAVLVLRRKRPELTSSIPRLLGPFIPLFALFFIAILAGCASLDELLFGLGGLAVGVPLFFVLKYVNPSSSLMQPGKSLG
ncbi:MAG: APC family permease [Parachlamydiaceae bacterium]